MIYFKKVMEKEETMMRDGKTEKRHCVELCICGIKPEGSEEMESEDEEMDDEDAIENGLEEAEEKPKTKIEIEIGGGEEEED